MFGKLDYGHIYFYKSDHFCGAWKLLYAILVLFGFLGYLGDIIFYVKVLEKHWSLAILCPYNFSYVQIETRNNNLEMQSVNNKSLIEELDKLLERLRVPSEVCLYPNLSQMNLLACIYFNEFLLGVVCCKFDRRFIWWSSNASKCWSMWVVD